MNTSKTKSLFRLLVDVALFALNQDMIFEIVMIYLVKTSLKKKHGNQKHGKNY